MAGEIGALPTWCHSPASSSRLAHVVTSMQERIGIGEQKLHKSPEVELRDPH